VALMELQASRMRARVGPGGEPILLLDQDRFRWDQLLVRRGLAALARAEDLSRPLGPYTLQAAIAACHSRARTGEETDWKRIVALYDALVELTHSPVVELNRAVAVAMAFGPAAGLNTNAQLLRFQAPPEALTAMASRLTGVPSGKVPPPPSYLSPPKGAGLATRLGFWNASGRNGGLPRAHRFRQKSLHSNRHAPCCCICLDV